MLCLKRCHANVNDDNASDILELIEVATEVEESSRVLSIELLDDLPEPSTTPSHSLIRSIFKRAFLDLTCPEELIRRDAIKWINSNKTYSFSFLWCLQTLNLNKTPEQLRQIASILFKSNAN